MVSIVRKELFYQDNILLRFHNYKYYTSGALIVKATQHNTIKDIKAKEYKIFCKIKIFHIVLPLWVTR